MQGGRRLRYRQPLMAATQGDRAPHQDPRPALAGDPRAQGRASIADPLSIYLPVVIERRRGRDSHGRRRQHVHRLHRRSRLPQRRACAPARRRGGAGAGGEVLPHRLHDRAVRGVRDALRAARRASPRSRGPAKAAFFNAGTEAVENAVKFARAYTKRPAVIGFEGGFHGRTLLSLTLTSKTHPYKAGLGPFAPEVYRVPYPRTTAARAPPTRSPRSSARSSRRSRAESVAAIVDRARPG